MLGHDPTYLLVRSFSVMDDHLKFKKLNTLSIDLLESSKQSFNNLKNIKKKGFSNSFLDSVWVKWYASILITLLLLVSIIAINFYPRAYWIKYVALFLLVLLYVYFLLYIIAIMIHNVIAMKKLGLFLLPHFPIIQNAQDTVKSDSDLLQNLIIQDVEVLQYAKLHLISELKSLNNRVSFLIGPMKKVGLLPAVLAFIVLAQNINLDSFSLSFHPLITALLGATPCLYIFSGSLENVSDDLERHISIYEFVINIKNKEL